MAARTVDVAVIGDGPAGSALAQACVRGGGDVVLIGEDDPWTATYGTWVDDLPIGLVGNPTDVLVSTIDHVRVQAIHAHQIDRAYGVFDNEALRRSLRRGVDHLVDRVESVSAIDPRVDATTRQVVTAVAGHEVAARFVIDATGSPPAFAASQDPGPRAWQIAFGVVLPVAPTGPLGAPTLMDFGQPEAVGSGGRDLAGVATFCYSLPVRDGWLVEETVLAAATAIVPDDLLPRLAARLDSSPEELLRSALRTESVRIPMGTPRPVTGGEVVAFGAAAGYIHPATGFSVAASLRAAPRVASALLATDATTASVRDAVWPRWQRQTRVLHDHGLDVLLRLEPGEVATFFDAFFDLPQSRWAAYLRIDAEPTEVAAAMMEVFRSTSWPMRRRLMRANPLALARLLRP